MVTRTPAGRSRLRNGVVGTLLLGTLAFALFGTVFLPGPLGGPAVHVAYADGGDDCPDGPPPHPDPNAPCVELTATPTATPTDTPTPTPLPGQ